MEKYEYQVELNITKKSNPLYKGITWQTTTALPVFTIPATHCITNLADALVFVQNIIETLAPAGEIHGIITDYQYHYLDF